MAKTTKYTGNEPAVAQVEHATVGGTIEVGDIFTLTVTGLDGSVSKIMFVATATTIANVTAGLTSAWNASSDANITPITATDFSTYVRLTADTPGIAFTVSEETTESGGGAADDQTFVLTTLVANAGPHDFNDADNWSNGLPANGDTVYIEDAVLLYNLDALDTDTTEFAKLVIRRSQIGVNPAKGNDPLYLQIRAAIVEIDEDEGIGSSSPVAPINLDVDDVTSEIKIFNTGNNGVSTKPAVRLKMNNADETDDTGGSDSPGTNVTVFKGKVGIASEDGETAALDTLTIHDDSVANTSTNVIVGSGVTLETLKKYGGQCKLKCAVGTSLQTGGGSLTTEGTGAITTHTNKGGTFISNSTGTIATVEGYGGIIDTLQNSAIRTITAMKLDPTCILKMNEDVLTTTLSLLTTSNAKDLQITVSEV